MLYKGCILAEEKNYIVVLTKDSTYIKLKKKGSIDIGKEIFFLEEDILKEKKFSATSYISIAAAIIFLLITTTLFYSSGYNIFNTGQVYAMVSLDINPSIHFKIDNKNRVQETIPLNKEAHHLLDPHIIGMSIENAIHLTIKKAIDQQYITKNSNTVLISKVTLKGDGSPLLNLQETVIAEIEDDTEIKEIEVVYIDSSKETLEESQKENMSIGKYELYKEIQKDNPNESIQEIKTMKVEEIITKNSSSIKITSFVKDTKDEVEDTTSNKDPKDKKDLKNKKDEEKEILKDAKESEKQFNKVNRNNSEKNKTTKDKPNTNRDKEKPNNDKKKNDRNNNNKAKDNKNENSNKPKRKNNSNKSNK